MLYNISGCTRRTLLLRLLASGEEKNRGNDDKYNITFAYLFRTKVVFFIHNNKLYIYIIVNRALIYSVDNKHVLYLGIYYI